MLLLAVLASLATPDDLTLTEPVVLRESARVKPGTYVVSSGSEPVVTIDADNVTIDFQGANLKSAEGVPGDSQDGYQGIGVSIGGHKNVTIKNANVFGFKTNFSASDSLKIRFENCNGSYSQAQRIWQNGAANNIFLDVRNPDVWPTYGAGFLLSRCTDCTVTRCTAESAQNGVVLLSSAKCTVHDNQVSFNSGWGIALNGSSDNVISWNHADFDNRPWGGGWGGDSAAIVLANGSARNFVVGNSMTHGGDGFFLTDRFNGQPDESNSEFMGSSDDNVVAYNDGSWSPHNAFESTFSFRNTFYANAANDSGYGFWMGYSRETTVMNNQVARNGGDGIAWEHGSGAWVEGNQLDSNKVVAIHFWGSAEAGNPYPSKNLVITNNSIRNSQFGISAENSSDYHAVKNQLSNAPLAPNVQQEPEGSLQRFLNGFEGTKPFKRLQSILKTKPSGFRMYCDDPSVPKGLEWIQADAFAPRSFHGRAFAWRPVADDEAELFRLSAEEPKVTVPDWITLTKSGDRTYRAVAKSLDKGVGRFETATIQAGDQTIQIPMLATVWTVRWFEWDKAKLPVGDTEGWESLFASAPAKQTVQSMITADYSFRPPTDGIRTEYWAFDADTSIQFPKGKYVVNSLADDGIRITVDGKDLIVGWRETPGFQTATLDLDEGVHKVRVRFMQTWGNTYLLMSIRRVGG